MTAKELKQWRERLGLTQEGAADLLGISRPTIARYEKRFFADPIPKAIFLACFAIEFSEYLFAKSFEGFDLRQSYPYAYSWFKSELLYKRTIPKNCSLKAGDHFSKSS